MTSEELIRSINFPVLSEQKHILMNMIRDWGEADDKNQREESELAEGLVSLIDAIQDHAVDDLKIDEKLVFNINKES